MTRTKEVTLNNGVVMPLLGYGVFQIPDPAECERCVLEAISAGYRSIDTAAAYGNEEAVGRAIRASGVPREELFVTTKLWASDAGDGRTRAAFERAMSRLQLDYLDLFLIHQPFGDIYGAWRDMEALNKEGRVRAIGVSNFHPDRTIDLIVHNEIVPAVNQVETHPYNQQIEHQAILEADGVQIEAWSPFAEGKNDLFHNELLVSIAANHNVTVAQVVLRWLTQRGVVAIPKSVRRDRMEENLASLDFDLTDAEMKQIVTLDTGTTLFFDHRNPDEVRRLGSWVLPA